METEIIKKTIVKLLEDKGLGPVILPISSVSGGYMHRMYRAETEHGTFAVKHLNPGVIKRPDALGNFKNAERYESMLESAGIPIVPAIVIDGSKMQELGDEYFYIFRWQEGSITDWYDISAKQCRIAGSIQGRIHRIDPRRIEKREPQPSAIDWNGYIAEAERQCSVTEHILRENKGLLYYAQDAVNRARDALPALECIVDEDMDPKNVMWDEGKPYVIDLECLERGNPVSSALQLSLQWAGVTTCRIDPDKLNAFFEGYIAAYDNGFRDYGSVFGLAYTWIEWLEFNIGRALGRCEDEAERETGIAETLNTVARIRYLRENEDLLVSSLNRLFD